uniref:Putative thionin-2.4 n=1 Tax=Noccaea caerulescens TaxID=107243 RepID=A0A1J3JV98_NOCCA
MEGKTVTLSVVIMTLVMAQIQVEAAKICCPTAAARTAFNGCAYSGFPSQSCVIVSGCTYGSENSCPPGYPNDILKKSAQGDAVNEYCKLGCAFSVCGAMTNLQNSDANEIVNGAVEQCTNACSTICSEGFLKAVKSA